MKIIAWLAGVIVVLLFAFLAMQIVASERVEVVVLHSVDAQGEIAETRLWVVDYKGSPYLRAGQGSSGWLSRLMANPDVEVERGGEKSAYVAVTRPELVDEINELMQAKYGWGDTIIGYMTGDWSNALPVQLVPASGG